MVFEKLFDDFWGSELKRVLKWNFGSFWQASSNGKKAKSEKNNVNSGILKGYVCI